MAITTEIELAAVDHGAAAFLTATRIPRGASSDLVLSWSTKLSAHELISKCDAMHHAPDRLTHLEIVADDRMFSVEQLGELEAPLRDAQLVRFNFNDWSITWLRGHGAGEGNEVQAVLGNLPTGMAVMVEKSVAGVSAKEVRRFFADLKVA